MHSPSLTAALITNLICSVINTAANNYNSYSQTGLMNKNEHSHY